MLVHTCSHCLAQRRFPAPPLLPEEDPATVADQSESHPDSPPPCWDPAFPHDWCRGQRKRTKREKREARQARKPIFSERKGHVVVKGSTVIKQGDGSGET